MQKSFVKSLLFVVIAALAVAITPGAFAQLVSSGMTGIVRGSDGKVLSAVTVNAVHTPTNAKFTAISRADGRFNFRGLPVGGPYVVTAQTDGYAPGTAGDVTTELGQDIDVNFTLRSDVVQLEAFVATASRTDLDSTSTGAGRVLNAEQLANKPTSERSLADMISATPLVTLRSTFGDREESQITAVGQNNRYNSVLIDGARINDQFGLNGTGLASFFNPLSIDTIEQLSVQISPYDSRLSGFTGASINAVTKSGTNEFKGSAYYYFRGDHLFGSQLQGQNEREHALNGKKIIPKLERSTTGFTLGGPIWKDHIFFFANYEKFKSVSAGRDPRFSTDSEGAILARLTQYSAAINWGKPVTNATSNAANDKKLLAKVDWQINANHRASFRYSTTEGEVPQFGNFANGTSNLIGINGGITTSSDGHFFSQTRKEKATSAQLFSQWTPDFKTEVKYSATKQNQNTPLNTVAPLIFIFGVSGTDLLNNTATTNGTYIVGTEQFRHGNLIRVDAKQYSVIGDYFWKDLVFTGGVEREQTDFLNVFRQGSFGLVAFRTLNDFFNDTNVSIQRNVFDPTKRALGDISDFSTTGVFGQVKWNVSSRLNINFGLREEFAGSNSRPAFNAPLFAATGFRNDGTVDGVKTFSPRLGFNLSVDEARTTQVRGGAGHFLGRAPWVFFSNSFNDIGVGSFTQINPAATLGSYLTTQFDPNNPIGTAVDDGTGRRTVNFTDDGIKLPSLWRASFAVDHKLGFLNSTISAELVYSKIDQALFIRNENLKPLAGGLSADGRQRFSGNPAAGAVANALNPGFLDLFHVKNVSVGESTYASVVWDRPVKNKWGFTVAYTRGHSTEAQAVGQTTASGSWQRNVVFNQGATENGISDFQIKDRVQVSLVRQFEFIKKWKTTAALYYEGRTGNPYSFVYSTDLNGDGRADQDAVAVPTGLSDPRFDFSGMTSAQQDAMFAFINSSGLARFAGGIAPKNTFSEPWVNRLDLKLSQQIPIHGSAKLSLFFDFVNFGSFISAKTFGFTETAPGISNDVFRRRFLGGASYAADGRIKPTFAATPANTGIDNGMSRWRIQLGAKVEF